MKTTLARIKSVFDFIETGEERGEWSTNMSGRWGEVSGGMVIRRETKTAQLTSPCFSGLSDGVDLHVVPLPVHAHVHTHTTHWPWKEENKQEHFETGTTLKCVCVCGGGYRGAWDLMIYVKADKQTACIIHSMFSCLKWYLWIATSSWQSIDCCHDCCNGQSTVA